MPVKQQIGNITSELSRAVAWEKKADSESRDQALFRALELIDMTVFSFKGGRRREMARFREAVSHCFVRSKAYNIELRDLESFGLSHFGC